MSAHSIRLVLAAAGLAIATAATAGEKAASSTSANHVELAAGELKWGSGPKSLPAGAQSVVLEGDPAQKGIFALRLKLPAGYRIAPHTHPRQERVTVLSGRIQLGHGRTFDESKLKDLAAGSFFSLPPGMEHFARAAEDSVVQLNSDGPWEIHYVNPADDPRKGGTAQR
jgi:quercetin dioxygenase-like cupin family protein